MSGQALPHKLILKRGSVHMSGQCHAVPLFSGMLVAVDAPRVLHFSAFHYRSRYGFNKEVVRAHVTLGWSAVHPYQDESPKQNALLCVVNRGRMLDEAFCWSVVYDVLFVCDSAEVKYLKTATLSVLVGSKDLVGG